MQHNKQVTQVSGNGLGGKHELCSPNKESAFLNGTGHLVITQINFKHKNLLCDKQWRAVDSVKHCEKRLPLK